MILIGDKGIAADKLDCYTAKVLNALIILYSCSDGGIVEGKGIAVGVVAYSSAYTLKVGDIVAIF